MCLKLFGKCISFVSFVVVHVHLNSEFSLIFRLQNAWISILLEGLGGCQGSFFFFFLVLIVQRAQDLSCKKRKQKYTLNFAK